jgi:hypothetical protein
MLTGSCGKGSTGRSTGISCLPKLVHELRRMIANAASSVSLFRSRTPRFPARNAWLPTYLILGKAPARAVSSGLRNCKRPDYGMGVDLGGGDISVAQEFLRRAQVVATLLEGGEAVPQRAAGARLPTPARRTAPA